MAFVLVRGGCADDGIESLLIVSSILSVRMAQYYRQNGDFAQPGTLPRKVYLYNLAIQMEC